MFYIGRHKKIEEKKKGKVVKKLANNNEVNKRAS